VTFGPAGVIADLAGPTLLLIVVVAFFLRKARSARPVRDGPQNDPYRVFTREFDLTLPALEAIKILNTASPDGERGWLSGAGFVARAAAEVDAVLAAQVRADRVSARTRIEAAAGALKLTDIVVAVLIDQSGSMKGRPIAIAAAAASWLCELLGELGAPSEVLGFSTAGWHGGHAYRKWKRAGKPSRPGRLCALRHVIYKTTEESRLSVEAAHALAHPDLLRENVDGEALEWAWERLSNHHQPHKLLFVLSDGAPVDDATLLHNGPSYLWRHMTATLSALARERTLAICAIGIGHEVSAFYPLSETVGQPAELVPAAVRVLETAISLRAGKELSAT